MTSDSSRRGSICFYRGVNGIGVDSNSSIPSAYSAFSNPGGRRHPAREHLRAQDLAIAKDSRRAPQDDHRKNRPRNNRPKRHQLIGLARWLMGQACKVGEWRRRGNPPVPAKLDERTCVALITRPTSRCAFSTGMQSPARFHYRRCRRLALQTPRQRDHATYRCAFQPPYDSIPWNAPIQQNLPVRRLRAASFRQHTSPWQ